MFGAVGALDFEHPEQRLLGLMMIDSVNHVFTCVSVICTSFFRQASLKVFGTFSDQVV